MPDLGILIRDRNGEWRVEIIVGANNPVVRFSAKVKDECCLTKEISAWVSLRINYCIIIVSVSLFAYVASAERMPIVYLEFSAIISVYRCTTKSQVYRPRNRYACKRHRCVVRAYRCILEVINPPRPFTRKRFEKTLALSNQTEQKILQITWARDML